MEKIDSGNVKQWAKDFGADIVGIAPVDRFDGAPPGHGPLDLLPKAKSVIVAGIRIPDTVVEYDEYHLKMEDMPQDFNTRASVENFYMLMGHYTIDIMLNTLAVKMANRLERDGRLRSLPTPNTVITGLGHPVLGSKMGFFSHRHAATRAGLGEFGLNNILLTPEFGPRVRLVSIITEAALEPDPLISQKLCLRDKCGGNDGPRCFRRCAEGALQLREGIDYNAIFIDTPTETNIMRCAGQNHEEQASACIFMGTCMRDCPLGTKVTGSRASD